jgi:hypothetical protein
MITPATLTAEMLAQMAKNIRGFMPPSRSTLLLSAGYRERLKAESPVRSPADANPLLGGAFSFSSIPVRTLEIPKEKVFDWSACRSPSRAKRRQARGYPQRVKVAERDIAYLVDQRILSDMTGRLDRMCAKLLFDGEMEPARRRG